MIRRTLSIPLGILTMAPSVYLLLVLFGLAPALSSSSNSAAALVGSSGLSSLAFGGWLVCLLVLFYVVFIWRTRSIPRPQKSTWTLLIILGNLITMPALWYIYFWKGPAVEKLARA